MRFFMSYSASYTLYDPIYAAKVKNAVREETIRIDEGDYESFQNGTLADSEDLNEAVADTAEDFGKTIVKTMKKQPWKTTVLSAENGRILIAGDESSGLRVGSRMAVYEGRRVMDPGEPHLEKTMAESHPVREQTQWACVVRARVPLSQGGRCGGAS